MNMKLLWTRAVSLIIIILLALPLPAMAQTGNDAGDKQPLSKEQLAQLLAPIALYPDELIAQVLMASTYPLEIVMAERWIQQNKDLTGTALANALEQETWDPSVKSLVNLPSVLSMLSQKLDLTTKLGDAFLDQQEDVMSMVQELRNRAVAAGNLKSSGEQKVVVEEDSIVIEPADPGVIYVPTYDPFVVFGPWWFPAFPPFFFFPPLYPGSVLISYPFGVSLGFAWGYAWGGCNWHNHDVFINVNRNVSFNPYINRHRYVRNYESRGGQVRNGQIPWRHDPGHRRGVAYKHEATARQFGQLPARRGEVNRVSRGFNQPGRSATGQIKSPERGSVFTGSDRGGARRSSERGRQSIGRGVINRSGPAAPPRMGISPGVSRGSGGNVRSGVGRTPVGGGQRGPGRGAIERK